MNIVNKLTLRHLKQNKSRTVVTTLGICVSVAMITAVFVAAFSLMNLLGNLSILENGNWHETVEMNTETFEQFKKDDRVEKIGIATENNWKYIFNSKNDTRHEFLIAACDSELIQMLLQSNYEGRLPENSNEIMINKKTLDRFFPGAGLSSEITFLDPDSNDGTVTFEMNKKATYKVVGIMNENRPVNIISLASPKDTAESLSKGTASVYFTLKKLNFNSENVLNDINIQYGFNKKEGTMRQNSDLLMSAFALSKDSFALTTVLPLCMICLAIIIIASVMLIYNAFGMSLSERIRYLGMLASVGATKKQKRASVYFEGLLLGVIGIPVGIIAGFIGIAITLYFVGDRVIESGMLTEAAKDAGVKFTATANPFVIALIILFSALTILISLYIPARKASKTTPIDAIRQKDDFKLKARRIRSSKLVRLIFGYEGELANKSLKRNRRKTNMITASIALSVILFLCVNYFCQMLIQSNDYVKDVPYDIVVGVTVKDKEELEDIFTQINEIDESYHYNLNFYSYISNDDMDKNSPFVDSGNYKPAYQKLLDNSISVFLTAVNDEDFNRLCKENKLNPEDFYGQKNLKCVLMDDLRRAKGNAGIFNSSIVGKTYSEELLDDSKKSSFTYEIGGLAKFDPDNYLCMLNGKGVFSLYCPISEYLRVYDGLVKSNVKDIDSLQISYGIKAKNHSTVYDKLCSMLNEKGIGYSSNYYAQNYQILNSMTFALQVFVYGFITLITMIATANIINTVSTGIMMRRKEFAMLKSVGTTPKGFNKMICLESFFYGAKALVFALPVSLLICYIMNATVGSDAMPFTPNILTYLGSAAVVFAIVGVAMYYSVRKLKDDSIVETLKTEIN